MQIRNRLYNVSSYVFCHEQKCSSLHTMLLSKRSVLIFLRAYIKQSVRCSLAFALMAGKESVPAVHISGGSPDIELIRFPNSHRQTYEFCSLSRFVALPFFHAEPTVVTGDL